MAEILNITPAEYAQEQAGMQSLGAVVRGGITVKPHVQALADALERELGVSNFGTYVGHSPPEGPTQAMDIFTPDNESGYKLQDRICEFLIRNQKKYGVRYCIRRHHIWNIERADEGWRDQGVQGNRTADHYDHVHVTCYVSAEKVDEPEPTPAPIKREDAMSLSVRMIYRNQTPGQVGNLDWVFDGPSRIFAPVGAAGVLRACDKSGVVELGVVDDDTFNWFSGVANGWRNG